MISEIFSDLFEFQINTFTWRNLSILAKGLHPAARYYHGFTSSGDSLYVYGGTSTDIGKFFGMFR